MKIRQGFVSNSSSASFVLVGFSLGDFDTEEFYDEDYDIDFIYEGEGGAPDGEGVVVGRFLLYVKDDDWARSKVIDLDALRQEVEAIREELGARAPIKIYTGMQVC